ncbi:hypothetical protein ISCU110981_19390 [Isoptericola cucumis]
MPGLAAIYDDPSRVSGWAVGAVAIIAGTWLIYLSIRLRLRPAPGGGVVVYGARYRRVFGPNSEVGVTDSVGEVVPFRTWVPTIDDGNGNVAELIEYSHYEFLGGKRKAQKVATTLRSWM